MSETTPLPSQAGHWYHKDGRPCYEVPRAKGDGMRPTNLGDARKLGLVPSVTEILNIAAKPGLEAWKAKQLLEASLTLPRLKDESLDDYAVRVVEDSKAQSQKAMQRGTDLHAAIEEWIKGQSSLIWQEHINRMVDAMGQYGIFLSDGKAEHSFASPLGYGGKIDFHTDEVLIDFKTKDRIVDKKQLAWPEHCWQLAAYAQGLGDGPLACCLAQFRCINVFIGVEDKQVRVHEWKKEDCDTAWEVFSHLLAVWKIVKKYNP